jgi:glucosamine-6-phosphate deaminase
LEVAIAQDRLGIGRYSASLAAAALRDAIEKRGNARLIVATGSSQFEVLEALTQLTGIDWTKVDAFHLDEYIGLAMTHPASFCGYLRQRFVEKVPLKSFLFLDGQQDPQAVIAAASQAVTAAPIDVALVGIGENGHLAFNDPPADFKIREPYHIVELDEACRRQQVGEGWFDRIEQVPKTAISMTIQQILATSKIVCSVPDRRKAAAVAASLQGPITPDVPASILQQHPDITLVLDQGSASDLSAQWIHLAQKI